MFVTKFTLRDFTLIRKVRLHLQVQQACLRKMLLVRGAQAQGQGHWPIPEAYWPDPTHQGISPREPHPMIAYRPIDSDPHIPANFVFDKYEVSFFSHSSREFHFFLS